MDHSSVIYLMDSKGAFAEVFRVDRPPEQSAKELEGYL
jgi:cytochrome oxidase Cu insertion factor (SCO1/SenC/PrrC family)